jgi:hypothetical protein
MIERLSMLSKLSKNGAMTFSQEINKTSVKSKHTIKQKKYLTTSLIIDFLEVFLMFLKKVTFC